MIDNAYITKCVSDFLSRTHKPKLSIAAALFDMDGTLYDSMPCHADAWMQMCRANGLHAERDEFFLFEGRTGASTLGILFDRQFSTQPTDEQIKELYHQKTVNFRALQPVPIMPGAQSLTQQCVDMDLRCVLVTGSGQSSLIDRLPIDFPGVFDPTMSVTSHDVTHGKPHPEPYLKALERAGVTADKAIVFENAPLGVRSAADAGIFTIAVVTGPIPRKEMQDAGASIIFDSMPECAAAFPTLIQLLSNP